MPNLNLSKKDIPLWFSGEGEVVVQLNSGALNQPVPADAGNLLNVNFNAGADQTLVFGAANSLKLGVKSSTTARLTPITAAGDPTAHELLAAHGLSDYFDAHPDELILALRLGASADASAAESFRYGALAASGTLSAGGDVGFTYLRPYPRNEALEPMIRDFVQRLRLPANVPTPPEPGEVYAFEYGGYLKLSAGLSAGYELQGAPSFAIGQLQLSEHYKLSVIGKLTLGASVAGNFAVEVRAAADAAGMPMPGWARVIVRRKRANTFSVAADVNVDAKGDLKGLPKTGNEFLGALLGVNAKNWLNMIDRVRQLSDFAALEKELDGLAKDFIAEWTGKAFGELAKVEEFTTLLGKVHRVIESYEKLDNTAITLFDRYFDRLNVLTAKLDELRALTSWDRLKGEVDADLWSVVRQLTDGDPLGWMLGHITLHDAAGQPVKIPSLKALQDRAEKTLAMVKDGAHEDIRNLVRLAKEHFPLDGFFTQLATVDTIPEIKAIAEQKLGHFAERLIGVSLKSLSNSDLGKAVTQLHQALEAAKTFEDRLYTKFKEAASQNLSFTLHTEYSRADERTALLDVMINLGEAEGREMLRAAGHGDFAAVLSEARPELVRLNEGVLTHRVARASAFNVNVLGWHSGWHYQGLDQVIVNTEQHVVTEQNGALTVLSTTDLLKERRRDRDGRKMYTNFLLRFIGESRGLLRFDRRNQQYLIDAITGMGAKYDLGFSDPETNRARLEYYLSFAQDFGLADQGASAASLIPLLERKGGDDFGPVSVDYEVRYTEVGLRRLFAAAFDENAVRLIMRRIILANYVRDDGLRSLGWAYWTPGVHALWRQQGFAQFISGSSGLLEFKPIQASPFPQLAAPPSVSLSREQRAGLSTLYSIEELFIRGCRRLDALIQQGGRMSAHEFENALGDIGRGLELFDDFDEGVNTIFAVFDQLIRLQTPASEARASSLKLVSFVTLPDGKAQQVTKVFIAQAAPSQIAGIGAGAMG